MTIDERTQLPINVCDDCGNEVLGWSEDPDCGFLCENCDHYCWCGEPMTEYEQEAGICDDCR